jgi:hypothetical protein
MSAGEYRKRYQLARKWVSDQMVAHRWGGAGNGQSVDHQELQRRAAELFGLDRHWQRAGNPIIHRKL